MAVKKPKIESCVGKYVICFQMVGKQTEPFEAQIVGEPNGSYWLVKIGRGKAEYRVNKGSCSTIPFRKKEVNTPAYCKKVLASSSASGSSGKGQAPTGRPPAVRKPSRKHTASTKKPSSSGRK